MTETIRISWPSGSVSAALRNTPTTAKLLAALPCTARASTWGEEVYFTIPVDAVLESDARQVVEPGTVCFWVEGASLALPYGATPIAQKGESRLVTKCNVIGKIDGDPGALAGIRDGDTIKVSTE
ncbi:MAG TPA: cyclophilin-like fold protein [Burkholderiales bacterium]